MGQAYETQSASTNTSGTTYAAGGEAALALLIQQLLGGGTPQQKLQQKNKQEQIGKIDANRAGYTKDEAFADAQGAMSQELRLAMEKLVNPINNAARGAGTSQGSMRALLLEEAANRSAESAAALGLKAAGDYGTVYGNLSNVLSSLITHNDPVVDDLISAINLTKGTETTTNSSGSGSGGVEYGRGSSMVMGPTNRYGAHGGAVFQPLGAGGGSPNIDKTPWEGSQVSAKPVQNVIPNWNNTTSGFSQ